jgi:hypothetical protein
MSGGVIRRLVVASGVLMFLVGAGFAVRSSPLPTC